MYVCIYMNASESPNLWLCRRRWAKVFDECRIQIKLANDKTSMLEYSLFLFKNV